MGSNFEAGLLLVAFKIKGLRAFHILLQCSQMTSSCDAPEDLGPVDSCEPESLKQPLTLTRKRREIRKCPDQVGQPFRVQGFGVGGWGLVGLGRQRRERTQRN